LAHHVVLLRSLQGGGEAGPAGGDESATHWSQVSAQLRWNQGWSHLSVFFSQNVLGLMSWHGASVGGGGGGPGVAAAAHWPQVIAQLVCIHGRWQL
tara:strand:- start:392 stop:679 length:288 start_codon:yes stop_codon:yes gene_type:complete